MGEVKVKDLVWEDWAQGGMIADMNGLLEYSISKGFTHWRLYVGKTNYLGAFDTADDAKRFAQTDYSNRIFSALE